MLHNPAVGWAVFPFPVTPTELGCSPNENPLFPRAAWADCIEGRVLAFSRASGPTRECGTTYWRRQQSTMSRQHSPATRASLPTPNNSPKYDRMDNLPRVSSQEDLKSPSDDGTETETMWVFVESHSSKT